MHARITLIFNKLDPTGDWEEYYDPEHGSLEQPRSVCRLATRSGLATTESLTQAALIKTYQTITNTRFYYFNRSYVAGQAEHHGSIDSDVEEEFEQFIEEIEDFLMKQDMGEPLDEEER